jgi:glucokinase
LTTTAPIGTSRSPAVVVALDVGGTATKCALVDETGTVRHRSREPTDAGRGPEAVVGSVADLAEALTHLARDHGYAPVAVGVVVPGVVDEATGVARWSSNLGFRDTPVAGRLTDRLGLPTVLGHDVRAGALAEARLGGGRAYRRMLFVAIGTGIAGGYVASGRIDPGAHGAAGEIGHVVVRSTADAPRCGCGAHGCLEALASAAAVQRAYVAAGGPPRSASEIAELAGQGDAMAGRVWSAAVDALADGLLTAVALLDPEVVVLGGGLAEAGPTLLEPLGAALARRATFHQLPGLAMAVLGDQAGCLGAALLALDRIGLGAVASGGVGPVPS